tara:strand:+ start:437 stop:700 length:264 start_codon:yes stop_codon:yes gene_type:complete
MVPINVLDLEELLNKEGYGVDEDTGEVYGDPEDSNKFLITLAACGTLNVKRTGFSLGFYIPHYTCYNSMDDYCQEFPNEQQCKYYDV